MGKSQADGKFADKVNDLKWLDDAIALAKKYNQMTMETPLIQMHPNLGIQIPAEVFASMGDGYSVSFYIEDKIFLYKRHYNKFPVFAIVSESLAEDVGLRKPEVW